MTTAAQDRELGLKILKSFYDSSRSNYPFAVQYSFNELLKTLESRIGGKTFVSGLGLAAALAEFDNSDISDSMYALAKAAGGKIPAKNGDFYAFMVDQGTKVSFTGAIVYTATESAKDIVLGAQQIGDSVLLTGKLINWLLPVIVIGFGYLYLKKKVS